MTDTRIDWWQLITDLSRAGFSHESIARECGVAKSAVHHWKNGGGSPRFEDGQRLIALWRRALDRQADPIPRAKVYA